MENQPQSSQDHCKYCFDVITSHLNSVHSIEWPLHLIDYSCPLFVSWYKGKAESLRGCIGTLSPTSIKKNLSYYAKVSAFQDSRFSPIRKEELSQLTCEVNFLTMFEKVDDVLDWELEKHGMAIEFEDSRGNS